jgi:hypothetical protein
MRNNLLFALTMSALTVAACSKKDDAPMTEDEFCQEYAQRECAAVAPLCEFAAASCEPTRVNDCKMRIAVWRTSTGGTRPFRDGNAQACLDKVKTAYATLPITGETLHALQDTCARVFQGTAKALETCAADLDCDGSLICDKSRCAEKKVVAAGGLCGNPGEICSPGESCKAAPGGVLQCSKRRAAGEACSSADPCSEALRCTGTCADRVTAGSCLQDEDCTSNFCSPFSKNCSVGLVFAGGSASCLAYMGAAATPDGAATTD